MEDIRNSEIYKLFPTSCGRSLSLRLRIILNLFVFLPFALFSLSCTKSPPPTVTELVASNAPTFGGEESRSYTTSSSPFLLKGECDPRHYGLEYSYNSTSWESIEPGCGPDGKFSFAVEVLNQQVVYVRAKTKLAYTPFSRAYIRLLLPPTSPFYSTVTAGAVRNQGQVMGIESAMPNSFSTHSLENADLKVLTGILGVVYAE